MLKMPGLNASLEQAEELAILQKGQRYYLREAPGMKYVLSKITSGWSSPSKPCAALRAARSGWYARCSRRHQINTRQQFRLACDAAFRESIH